MALLNNYITLKKNLIMYKVYNSYFYVKMTLFSFINFFFFLYLKKVKACLYWKWGKKWEAKIRWWLKVLCSYWPRRRWWKPLHQIGKSKPEHLFQRWEQWLRIGWGQRNMYRKWQRGEQGTSWVQVLATQANQTMTSSVLWGRGTRGSSSCPLHLPVRVSQSQLLD